MLTLENVVALQQALTSTTLELDPKAVNHLREYVFDILTTVSLDNPAINYVNILYDEHKKHFVGTGKWSLNEEYNDELTQAPFKDVDIFTALFRPVDEKPVSGVAIWHARINLWEESLKKIDNNLNHTKRFAYSPTYNYGPMRLTVSLFRIMQTNDSICYIIPEFVQALKTFHLLASAYLSNPTDDTQALEQAILNLKVRVDLYKLYLDDLNTHLTKVGKARPLTQEAQDALQAISTQHQSLENLGNCFTNALADSKATLFQALILWFFPNAFPQLKPRNTNQNWLEAITKYLDLIKGWQASLHSKPIESEQPVILSEQEYEFLRRIVNDVSRLNLPRGKDGYISELIEQVKALSDEKEAEKIATDVINEITDQYYGKVGRILSTYLNEMDKESQLYQFLIGKIMVFLNNYVCGEKDEDPGLPRGDERKYYIKLMTLLFNDWHDGKKHELKFYRHEILHSATAYYNSPYYRGSFLNSKTEDIIDFDPKNAGKTCISTMLRPGQ